MELWDTLRDVQLVMLQEGYGCMQNSRAYNIALQSRELSYNARKQGSSVKQEEL